MYALEWTPCFIKAAKRFAKHHPELKQKIAIVLLALEQDPFQPSLKGLVWRIPDTDKKTVTTYMVRPALQGESFIGSKGKLRTYIRPLIEA